MTLESIKFGAQQIEGTFIDDITTLQPVMYLGGLTLNNFSNDNIAGRFDVIHERIAISDTECVNFHGIRSLHNISVDCRSLEKGFLIDKYGDPCRLDVIAFKREENLQERWTFLCNSKRLFLMIAEEFACAYTLEDVGNKDIIDVNGDWREKTAISQGVGKLNAKSFVKKVNAMSVEAADYDAYCAFLKYLLKEGKKERKSAAQNSGESFQITRCEFQMPGDKKDFHPIIERCLVFECLDFEKVSDFISCFLPQNIKKRVAWETKQLRNKHGRNFENKDKILEDYRQAVTAGNVLQRISEIQTEMERWAKFYKDGICEKNFGEKYLTFLQEKMKILENEIRKELELCDFSSQSEKERKGEIIDFVENFRKEDYAKGESLYQEYCAQEARFQKILENVKESMGDLKISKYFDFYHFGKILIGNCLRGKNIGKKDLDSAMMYFYGTDSPEEADKRKRRHVNRKKGEKGEWKVERDLKDLEKSGNYRIVPKMWNAAERGEVIKIYNPDCYINKPRECDHILIGKQGVFLIETKYWKDKVIVDKTGNWIAKDKLVTERIGNRTEVIVKDIGIENPVRQVDDTIAVLESFLKEKDVPVIGIICLAHSEGIIDVQQECPAYPIIREDLLPRFIRNYSSGNRELSDQEMEECLSLIEKYRYQEN